MKEKENKLLSIRTKPQYYSDEFKWQVVQEVLSGKYSKAEAQRVYGLGGKCAILNWMRKFNLVPSYNSPSRIFIQESPMPKKEEDRAKDQKIRELEKALELERNKSRLFEIIIEIAEDKYGLEIRKKSEAKQYSSLNQKKEKK
jgi:transposase-like protein